MSYLLASILWGLGGFVAGLVVGHLLRTHTEGRPHVSIGAVLMLLAAGIVATSVIEQAQRQADVECQLEANQAFRDALVERTTVANQDRDALKQLVNQIGASIRTDNDAGQAALHSALKEYRTTVAANEADRSSTPLPEADCD